MITWFLQTLSTPKPLKNGDSDGSLSTTQPSPLVSSAQSSKDLSNTNPEGITNGLFTPIEGDIDGGSKSPLHVSIEGEDLNGSFHVNVREDEVTVNCSLLDEMHRMATNDLKVRKTKSNNRNKSGADTETGDEYQASASDTESEHDSDMNPDPIPVCSRKSIAKEFLQGNQYSSQIDTASASSPAPSSNSTDKDEPKSESESESEWKISDSATRLSLSKIWAMQKDYFIQEAEVTLQRLDKKADSNRTKQSLSVVDTLASSNASLACEYARLVAAYIRDTLTSEKYSNTGSYQPFYILELGSGTGRFAWMFLNHFSEFAQAYDLFGLFKSRNAQPSKLPGRLNLSSIICYVLSDICLSHIEVYRQNPQLADFVEQGVLDFALVDAEDFSSIHLLERNIHIVPTKSSSAATPASKNSPEVSSNDKSLLSPDFSEHEGTGTGKQISLEQPLIAICNYLFSSLPQDAFRVTPQGGLEEVRPTIWSNSKKSDLDELTSESEDLANSWISWDALPLSSYARLAKKQRKEQISRLRKMQKEHAKRDTEETSEKIGGDFAFPAIPSSPSSAAFMYYSGSISPINDTLDDIVSSAAIMYDLSSRKLAPHALHNPFLAAKIATKFSKPRLSLIPTGALKCIECLRRISPKIQMPSTIEGYTGPSSSPSLVILFGDKCTRSAYTSLTSGRSTNIPLSYHGSISLPVNTALLKLYTELRGGMFLCPTTLGNIEEDDSQDSVSSSSSVTTNSSSAPSFSTCSIVFGSVWRDGPTTAFPLSADDSRLTETDNTCASPSSSRLPTDSLLRTPQQASSSAFEAPSSPLDEAKMLILTPAQRRASLVHKEMLKSSHVSTPTSPKATEATIPSENLSSVCLPPNELSLWNNVRGLRKKMRKLSTNLPSLSMDQSSGVVHPRIQSCELILSRNDTLSSFREAFTNYEIKREKSLPKLHCILTTGKDLLIRCTKGVVAPHELNDVLNFVIDQLREARCEPTVYGAILPGLVEFISSYHSQHISVSVRNRLISIAADSLRLYYPCVSIESTLDIDLLFETGRLALAIDALELAQECFFASLEESGNAAGCHWNLALCKLRRHSQTNLPLLEKDREWLRQRFELVLRSDPTTVLREDTLRALNRLANSSGITMR